jgi:hypothetical protein
MAPQLVLFLHISSSWVKIRLYIKNQFPRLSGRGLNYFLCDGTLILLLHISSIWVKIRLYTENQLPRLSGSGLNVCGCGLHTNCRVTPTSFLVEVGLWQYAVFIYILSTSTVLMNLYQFHPKHRWAIFYRSVPLDWWGRKKRFCSVQNRFIKNWYKNERMTFPIARLGRVLEKTSRGQVRPALAWQWEKYQNRIQNMQTRGEMSS